MPKSAYTNRSIVRAITVLEGLGKLAKPASLTELSSLLEIHSATLYRILEVLQEMDYVQKDKRTNKYTLGYRLYRLGRAEEMRRSIVRDVEPFMKRIAHSYEVTVVLGAIFGTEIRICTIESTAKSQVLPISAGHWLDAFGTSPGTAILANRPRKEAQTMFNYLKSRQMTKNRSLRSFLAELSNAKEMGYAEDDQQTFREMSCVAAPIINTLGYAEFCIAAFKPYPLSEPRASVIAGRILSAIDQLYEERVRHTWRWPEHVVSEN